MKELLSSTVGTLLATARDVLPIASIIFVFQVLVLAKVKVAQDDHHAQFIGPVEDPSSGHDAAWGIRATLAKA